MIIIFIVILTFSWLKQEISCNHFENCASKRPNIGWSIVISSNDNLWRSILPGLNLWSEVMMGPTSVTHITNLYHNSFIDLSSSLVMELVVLCLHLLHSLTRFSNFLSFIFLLEGVQDFFIFFGIFFVSSSDINIDVPDFLTSDIRYAIIILTLVQIDGWFNLRGWLLVFLLSLSLKLLSQILFLFWSETIKNLRIMNFRGSVGNAFRIFLRIDGQIILDRTSIVVINLDFLLEVIANGACDFHVHFLDLLVLTLFSSS